MCAATERRAEHPAPEPPAERTCLTCAHYRPVPESRQAFVEFAGVCLAPEIPTVGPFRTRVVVEPTVLCPFA